MRVLAASRLASMSEDKDAKRLRNLGTVGRVTHVHSCAKLTCEIAAAAAAIVAAAAAAAAKTSAPRRHEKKNKIFAKTWKTNKLQKTSKNSMKIDKRIDF